MNAATTPPQVAARPALLEIDDLRAAYGGSQVLFGIGLRIGSGDVATLLGRNGMGKTTTVRVLLGLLPPSAGTVRFLGERIDGLAPDRIARMGLALVPEGRQIFPNLSVSENLRAFAANRNRSAEPWTLERVYDLFPRLAERSRHMGNQLSGGEQQMLAIGRALMSRPRLLMLDEPSLGLAPLIARQIFDAIRTLNRQDGLTVLIVEQNANHALRLAHRGYVMVNGLITLSGPAAELLKAPEVRSAYLEGGRHAPA